MYIYVYIHICIYMCIYIHVYICIYTHIHTQLETIHRVLQEEFVQTRWDMAPAVCDFSLVNSVFF